ncbi:MAG: type III polyketide synthase [Candidatus Rokuibacteriota bacterium]
MDAPRIVAIGTAVPDRRFTQEELLELFGYQDGLRRRFFFNSNIDGRHLYLPQAELRPETVDEMSARFADGSVRLGVRAVEACLREAGVGPDEVDFLVTTTCTGRLVPSLDAHLIGALGLRSDVQRVHVGDTGCASAMVVLQQASTYLRAFPERLVLAVSVELCSATYYLDDEAETAVANAIFADGAAAVLLTTGSEGPNGVRAGSGPEILGHRTLIRPEHLDRMGFTFPDGRYRIRLAPEVRRIAPGMMEELTGTLLKDFDLRQDDVRFWVLHSAGRRVIENAQALLGLSDADVAYSREVLRRYGNLSSATVLFVLDAVLGSGRPQRGDMGLMMALGPGFAAEGAILRF